MRERARDISEEAQGCGWECNRKSVSSLSQSQSIGELHVAVRLCEFMCDTDFYEVQVVKAREENRLRSKDESTVTGDCSSRSVNRWQYIYINTYI